MKTVSEAAWGEKNEVDQFRVDFKSRNKQRAEGVSAEWKKGRGIRVACGGSGWGGDGMSAYWWGLGDQRKDLLIFGWRWLGGWRVRPFWGYYTVR